MRDSQAELPSTQVAPKRTMHLRTPLDSLIPAVRILLKLPPFQIGAFSSCWKISASLTSYTRTGIWAWSGLTPQLLTVLWGQTRLPALTKGPPGVLKSGCHRKKVHSAGGSEAQEGSGRVPRDTALWHVQARDDPESRPRSPPQDT